VTRIAIAVVLGAVAILGAARETGRVAGRVSITIPVSAVPPSAAYGARRLERPAGRPGSELSNVVVFISNAPAAVQLPVTRARILQENETFIPRVVAITRGSTVDFPNGDPFFHDVFSLSRSATFDLGSYPKGQTRSHVFRRAGLVKIYCHLHSHMTASIMVFDHPHFTMPKPDGTFALDGIAAGTYEISAWHERIGQQSQSVRIDADRPAEVQFVLPIPVK